MYLRKPAFRHPSQGVLITKNEIKETMEYISNYSLYAFEEEIRQGFIIISGDIGLELLKDYYTGNFIRVIHISYINVRLAHQVKGCADLVMPYLINEKQKHYHTLIILPQSVVSTYFDIIRQISTAVLILRMNIGG